MSRVGSVDCGGELRRSAAPRAAELLALAAAPVFVVMAIVTEVSGGGMEMPGDAGYGVPLSEMTTMYLLMAVFHAPVWVRRVRAGVRSA